VVDSGRARMARLFREQGDGCARLGSPLYAELLRRAGDDIDRGGVLADVLGGHEEDPGSSALALRLAGAVHRIVLSGRAPDLAPYYPSAGGTADAEAAWPAFRDTVAAHDQEIRALIESPPQTNEVGRAAVLMGALLTLAAAHGLPVRLLEFGTSAGLNLRAEAFRYELGDGLVVGDAESPVVLHDPWAGRRDRWPPTDVSVEVVERRGCDPQPADPLNAADQIRLMSYVWPDQVGRIDRLRAAFEVAARVPAIVERGSAQEFLARELTEPRSGVTTVVWHSVVWQYLDKPERERVLSLLAEAGTRATAASPLAHVAFEPVRPTPDRRFAFVASLQVWPGDGDNVIADGQGHGPPVVWK
jgi:hypothetical protein